jgi:hypothetical protein
MQIKFNVIGDIPIPPNIESNIKLNVGDKIEYKNNEYSYLATIEDIRIVISGNESYVLATLKKEE